MADVAAIDPNTAHGALQALTAAALLLPGLLTSPAFAAESAKLNLQTSRYEESGYDLLNGDSGLQPLNADTLHLSGGLVLRDSIRFAFGLTQDTWSGATPVAVAPLAANGNRPILKNAAQSVVIAGASPMVYGRMPLDGNLAPVDDARNVLIMSSASPEVRRQADISFEVPLELMQRNTTLTFGTGVSDEPDYLSGYGHLGGRIDFDQRLATLELGASFTRSSTSALLDADLLPYLSHSAYAAQLERSQGSERLRGERHDRAFELGFTRVLDAASVLDLGLGHTRSSGFMENPYKATTVVFVDPAGANGNGEVRALLEQRPDTRRQLALHTHYARHFTAAEATLQFDYTHSRDDWDIKTHSIELGWAQTLGTWTLTPRLRYYTQTSADFHTRWLVSRQPWRSILQPPYINYSAAQLPAHFSSDQRLAAFGAASAGLTLERRFAAGITVEAGVEYYQRASALQAGGTADSSYADFDFVMANVALTIDLQTTPRRLRREQFGTPTHTGHMQHTAHPAPAGVLFAHPASRPGSVMTGYRASHLRQDGALSHGTRTATDAEIIGQACSSAVPCRYAPADMTMTMHMFDLAYGISDSLTLMLMPQYMTMDMQVRELNGRPAPVPGVHEHGSGAHVSGAVGDTLIAGLFNLYTTTRRSVHASLGLSLPTGKVDQQYRRRFQSDGGLMHYDMQTGSGTWDLYPALTWNSSGTAWHWGAQLGGIKRLARHNDAGYRLGDQVQVSGWGAHAWPNGLAAALRAVFTQQGAIDGAYSAFNAQSGPMDFPGNHGGRFWDLGLGLNYTIAGSDLALEWLAPLHDDVNGFQLQRQGMLSASWHYNY